jgi:hypothetical protein
MIVSKKGIHHLILPALLVLFQGALQGQSFFASLSAVGETDICQGDSVAASIWFWGGASPYTVVIHSTDGKFLELKGLESQEIFYLAPTKSTRFYMASVLDSKGRKGSTYGSITAEVFESTPVRIAMERTAFLESEDGYPLASAPAGGSFSGPGVVGTMFYPAVAGSGASPHRITCSYENQNGCVTRDQIWLYVLSGISSVNLYLNGDIVSTVCDHGSTYTLLGSNEDGLAGNFQLFPSGSAIPLEGYIRDEDPDDNQADLSLDGLRGTYQVVYTYGLEEIEIQASTEFSIYESGLLGILNLPDSICKNDFPYPLIPEVSLEDPDASYTFSGTGVFGNQSEGYFLDPAAPVVLPGRNELILDYNSSNGCRTRLSVWIHIGVIPQVAFSPDVVCLETDGSVVPFTNRTFPMDVVSEWSWEFGDPASGAANTSKLENPEHLYTEPGPRTIVLDALTFDGCHALHSLDTLLVDIPTVSFIWDSDCYAEEQNITFYGSQQSVHSPLSSLSWIFSTQEGEVLDVVVHEPGEDSMAYSFPEQEAFNVSYIAQNEAGCQGELSQTISLTPVQVLSEDGFLETFEDMAEGWQVKSENQAHSWILGVPDFTGFEQNENDLAWYTNLPEQAEYLEHSWISTPCFDLSILERPVIQLDVMKSFTPGKDGAVLQYMDWESGQWTTLGNVGSGLNWYTDSLITNMPGGSSSGWSLSSFVPDNQWVNARYSLDGISGANYLKFRLAIATEGSQELTGGLYNQGFAFDNFFIGKANLRRSVLEYFTNSSDGYLPDADAMVTALAREYADYVYDLHYHMNVPEYDPMHANNPVPPSTRAFNYGVPVVPYAVLNGGSSAEFRFDLRPPSEEINAEVLVGSSLEAPLFEVFLEVEYLEDQLDGKATVVCVDDEFDSYLQLYIVVLESEVTSYPNLRLDSTFRNVVLDMLPSPAGTLIGNSWSSGKVAELDFSWDYADYIEDIEDLNVIAFVQDRETGSILQAADLPYSLVLDLPGKKPSYEPLILYPNPAEDFTTVKFGTRTTHPGELILVDISGQEVKRRRIQQGTNIQELDLTDVSEGMFMIFWKESGILKGQAKLIHHR